MPITWNRYNTCDVNVPERAAFFPRLARMSIKCQCPGSLIRIDLWSAVKGLYSNYFRDTEILIDSIMGTTIAGNRLGATSLAVVAERRPSVRTDDRSIGVSRDLAPIIDDLARGDDEICGGR